MKSLLRTFAHFLLRITGLYSLYALRRSSALLEDGWFKSFSKSAPMGLNGEPLIWFSYPAIDFIKDRVHRDMCVFEYGCGAGTLWWASRVKEVTACEHDFAWFEKISNVAPTNVHLFHAKLEYGGEYSKKILDYSKCFDIIIIDGRDRVNCAINCIHALKENGVVVFDDTDRRQYSKAFDFLATSGFKRIDFKGMGPGLTMKFETSVFYRTDNVFGI